MKSKVLEIICIVAMGCVCLADSTVLPGFGNRAGDSGWFMSSDTNGDGVIDGYDLAIRTRDYPQQLIQTAGPAYRADRILVRYIPNLLEDTIRDRLIRAGADEAGIRRLYSDGFLVVPVPDGVTVEQFLERIRGDRDVADAQFDYVCRASGFPNDPYFGIQWNFNHVRAPKAWDLTQGGHPDVIVAIIDTGIAYENYGTYKIAPDFAGTAFAAGYDFVNNDNHANDDEGHGTHVAGTVAETTNNAIGAAGLAWRCTLMPVKVLGADGFGSSGSLAEGIRWAADHGASVINMSLGFPTGTDGGPAVQEAIRYAYAKNVILVAAAGNEGNDKGYTGGVEYPAAYDECIAVGAIQYDKHTTNYSNYGDRLTCVAPGGKVYFDQNGDGQSDGILQQTFIDRDPTRFRYVFYEGTSCASPHVAAAAALFASRKGGSPADFLEAIKETSEDLGPTGFDPHYGFGLIDISASVRRGQGWGAN
ncbi:peptidase S8 [bacterium]|nr:peptidase S8 [candidate division CSSED10-310 bacterium]